MTRCGYMKACDSPSQDLLWCCGGQSNDHIRKLSCVKFLIFENTRKELEAKYDKETLHSGKGAPFPLQLTE